MVRDHGEPQYRARATAPPDRDLAPLSSDSRAVGLLQWLRKPVQLQADDRGWLLRHLPAEEIDSLNRAGIELLVPVQLGEDATEALSRWDPSDRRNRTAPR